MNQLLTLHELNETDWNRLQDLAERFEEAWSEQVVLGTFLPPNGDTLRPLALLELIKSDLEMRWRRKAGKPLEDYLRDFPELGSLSQLPPALVYEEYRARQIHGDRPPLAAYEDRFPDQCAALAELLKKNPIPHAAPTVTLPATRVTANSSGRLPAVGTRLGDFELAALLGEGAFARVFLARQISLDRMVALKVSARQGNEARTLARLEHDHIVQVFQESIDEDRDLLLVCMQYVPGTTLERVRASLRDLPRSEWCGQKIITIIDSLASAQEVFDPAALRDREFLCGCDTFEAVAWLGSRLAEALAYAHKRGVLHRDVKPANVLINCYGRPMLVDFNIARGPKATSPEVFGGTLAYMAPEHLEAFLDHNITAWDAVDARSDIYSLGTVLYELLTGESFPTGQSGGAPSADTIRRLAAERRQRILAPRRTAADVPETIDRIVRRCLDPEPARRFQSAEELAHALDGCRHLRRVERTMPPPGPIARQAMLHPLLACIGFIFFPHLVASAVNICYNALRIVSKLSTEQQHAFNLAVLGYNVIVYPICFWFLIQGCIVPILGTLRRLNHGPDPTAEQVAKARRRALAMPTMAMICACFGWFPGGLIFPTFIDAWAGPISSDVYVRFVLSFTISGLIAVAYSVIGLQYYVLRVLYPRLWIDGHGMRELAPVELRPVERRLRIYQFLAGLIPLAGAVMMLTAGPEDFDSGYDTFRILVTAMILLGTFGFGIALLAGASLEKTLNVLVPGEKGNGG
jgi:serine/threonine protein kinase